MCPFYVVAPAADQQQPEEEEERGTVPEDGTNGGGQHPEHGEAEAVDAPSYGHHLQYGRLVAVKRTWETWHHGGDGSILAGDDDLPTSDQPPPSLTSGLWHNGAEVSPENSPLFDQYPWHPADADIPADHSSPPGHPWHSADAMPEHTMPVDQPTWDQKSNAMADKRPPLGSDRQYLVTTATSINKHPPAAPQQKPSPISAPHSATLPRTQSTPSAAANRPWTPSTVIHTTINTTYQGIHGHHHQQLPTPPATPSPRGKAAATTAQTEPALLTDYSWRVTKSGDQRQIDESNNWVVPFSWQQRQPAAHLRVSSSVRNWTELEQWEREVAQRRPERGPRRGKSPPRYGRYAEFVEPKTAAQPKQQHQFGQDQHQPQQQFVGQRTAQAAQQQVGAVQENGHQMPRVVPQHQTQQQHAGVIQSAQQVGAVQGNQTLPRMGTQHRAPHQQFGFVQLPQQQVGAVHLPQQQFGAVQPPQQGFGTVQGSQELLRVAPQRPTQQQQQAGVVQGDKGLARIPARQPTPVQQPQQQIGAVQGSQTMPRIAQPARQGQNGAVQSPQPQRGAVPLPRIPTPQPQQQHQQQQRHAAATPQSQQQVGAVQGQVPKQAPQQQHGKLVGAVQLPRMTPQQQPYTGTVQGSQTLPRMAPKNQQQPQLQLGAVPLPRMASPQLQQNQQQQNVGAVQQQPKMAMAAQQQMPQQVGAVQGNQQVPRMMAPQQQQHWLQQQQDIGELGAENGTNRWEEWQECCVQLPAGNSVLGKSMAI
ncbi:hypothetical protein niasHT_034128 [Heterodera trifolii]|uniref:Uncharacterized protein n=1 Tax=Heterodera trifolii TaxID=157864 RepID=A0ABD2J6F8_9BILA